MMRAGDLLPASLQQLDIGEINFVQRLVGLTALRQRITFLHQLLLRVFLCRLCRMFHIRTRLAYHHCPGNP
jgi:hypothetical protein